MLRAYDKATGREVGAVYMPAPQTGSPMTYMLNGKQYIAVAISGGACTAVNCSRSALARNHMFPRRTPMSVALTYLALTVVSASEQWPQFRGLSAGVVADDPALPDTWSQTENVVWKTDIPGLGWSSPVVWGDHIIVTSAISAGREQPPVTGLYDRHDHVKAEVDAPMDGATTSTSDRDASAGRASCAARTLRCCAT